MSAESAVPARPVAADACTECASAFVQPLSFNRRADQRWDVDLRCPECEWHGIRVLDEDACEILLDAVEAGTAALLADLEAFAASSMAADVERFVDALHAGLILPEDF